MKRTHYHYMPKRQKKPRRLSRYIGFLGIILVLICGYYVVSFDKDTPVSSVEIIPLKTSLPKNVQLDWPVTGNAAIGSTEDGLLAHSSNNEKPSPTASMAKVIAALAILKKQPIKTEQTGPTYIITSSDVADYETYAHKGGSVMPVYEGMRLTEYQALQAMLLPSANNIADMLTKRIFGSEKAYISYAKDMLKNMGLHQTIVADASGFDPDTVSTPSELVLVGIAALKNPVIAKIVAERQAQIPGVGTISNTNELLGTGSVIGIKTGTTDEAGNCLLFAASYKDKDGQNVTLVGVIMGDTNAPNLYADSTNLLTSAKQGFNLTETQPANTTPSLPLKYRN